MWYGNTMLLLIAGIIGISPDIYEAAELDGGDRQTAVLFDYPSAVKAGHVVCTCDISHRWTSVIRYSGTL